MTETPTRGGWTCLAADPRQPDRHRRRAHVDIARVGPTSRAHCPICGELGPARDVYTVAALDRDRHHCEAQR
jgi:hypothetical protein